MSAHINNNHSEKEIKEFSINNIPESKDVQGDERAAQSLACVYAIDSLRYEEELKARSIDNTSDTKDIEESLFVEDSSDFKDSEIVEDPSDAKNVPQFGDIDTTDVYFIAYGSMMDSLKVQQDNFLTKATSLKMNANMQLDLLDQQKRLQYRTDIPNDDDPNFQKKMNEIQAQNQRTDNAKSVLQNTQATLKQSSSVMMAETNAAVNSENQKTAMISGFTRALNTVTESIAQITNPR